MNTWIKRLINAFMISLMAITAFICFHFFMPSPANGATWSASDMSGIVANHYKQKRKPTFSERIVEMDEKKNFAIYFENYYAKQYPSYPYEVEVRWGGIMDSLDPKAWFERKEKVECLVTTVEIRKWVVDFPLPKDYKTIKVFHDGYTILYTEETIWKMR